MSTTEILVSHLILNIEITTLYSVKTYRIHNYTLWHNVEFLSLKPYHTVKLLRFILDP